MRKRNTLLVHISSDFTSATIENCLDAIRQLQDGYESNMSAQMFLEAKRALKITCQKLHINSVPIDYEANRLRLYHDNTLNLYVMFTNKLPRTLKRNHLASLITQDEYVDRIKNLLMESDYQLHYDGKHYWLYDQYLKRDINNLDDFIHSLYLEDYFEKCRHDFTEALKNQAES